MNGGVPFLGFAGYSDSGKTTIIEKLIPRLSRRGLVAGYLKHDAHRLQIDKEGKDSFRLFQAGAGAVAVSSAGEGFLRWHGARLPDVAVFAECDIVLIEGYKDEEWDKVWVNSPLGGRDRPDNINAIAEVGGQELPHGNIDAVEKFVVDWLQKKHSLKPLYGGLLIGGKSSRMGSPKALVEVNGRPMAEIVRQTLAGVCTNLYLLGSGDLPSSLFSLPRLPDVPEVEGPMAGLVTAGRYAPEADWLIVAVDLPNLTYAYLQKLAEHRNIGFRFIAAQNPGTNRPEVTCAIYSSQLLHRLARSASGGYPVHKALASAGLQGDPSLFDEQVLKNINRPEDLESCNG